MQEWQERVVAERDELCVKLAKLRAFKLTPEYAASPHDQRRLLEQQSETMQTYADILGARIALFK
jgi:hypothetical protein